MSTTFLVIVITLSDQVVVSAVVQHISVKFLTTENMKPAGILIGCRAQFGDKTLSRTQVCEWSKSFKGGQTEAKNMQRLHLLLGTLWPAFLATLISFYSLIF
jgi:hypothetical protein